MRAVEKISQAKTGTRVLWEILKLLNFNFSHHVTSSSFEKETFFKQPIFSRKNLYIFFNLEKIGGNLSA